MNLNLILNAVSSLSEKLNCKIGFEPNTATHSAAAQKSSLSYYDKEKDTVIIRQERVRSEEDIIVGTVYALVAEKGLKNILSDRYNNFCISLATAVSRHSASMTPKDQIKFGEELLRDINMGTADIVARQFCHILDIPSCRTLDASLKAAINYNQRHETRLLVENNDTDSLDLKFKQSIIEGNGKRFFEFGKLSDAYRRIGYPDNRIVLSIGSDSMKATLTDPVLRKNILSSNFIEKIQSPLAIMDTSNGQHQSYAAVLDIKDAEGNYLVAYLPSPDMVTKNMAVKGPSYAVSVGTMGRITPENLLCRLLPKDGVNRMKYLQPTGDPDSSSFVLSRVVRQVKAMASRRLSDTYLNLIDKELWNFRNPMSSEKFSFLYGLSREERQEEKMKEAAAVLASLGSSKVDVKDDNAIIDRPPVRDFEKRLKTDIKWAAFSASVKRKMTLDGVTTAKDIISIGEDGIREHYGPKALRDATAFLLDNGLSFDCMRRHESLTAKMELEGMPAEALTEKKYEDLFKTLSAIPGDINSRSIPMPVTIRGNYLSSADAVALIAKMASTTRWNGCNMFITKAEADKRGLTIDPLAIATVVEHGGKDKVMYNIADTSLRDTEKFESIVKNSTSHSVSANSYVTSMLSSLRSARRDMIKGMYGHLQTMYENRIKEDMTGKKVPSLNAMEKGTEKREISFDRLVGIMKTIAQEEIVPEMRKAGIPEKNIRELIEEGVTKINTRDIKVKAVFNSAMVYAEDIKTGRPMGDFLQNIRNGVSMKGAADLSGEKRKLRHAAKQGLEQGNGKGRK